MRGLIFELRRDPVEDGLAAALREYGEHLCGGTSLAVDVVGPADRLPVARDTEVELFGIGREALTNIVKHAGATTATVLVDVTQDSVLLQICDDGCGFDPARRSSGHYGLETMRGRAHDIGAQLTISSSAEFGTLIRVVTPLAASTSNGG
jgi:signal transduction histidine kinase